MGREEEEERRRPRDWWSRKFFLSFPLAGALRKERKYSRRQGGRQRPSSPVSEEDAKFRNFAFLNDQFLQQFSGFGGGAFLLDIFLPIVSRI